MSPDFDELIGSEGLAPGERERLQRVHDLLVQAGPPPELPPSLARAPGQARVYELGRRRTNLMLLLAAALAVVVFAAGYLTGRSGSGGARAFAWTEPLRATAAGPQGASGSIAGTKGDGSGNWRMRVTVSGLEPLPATAYYVVYLTRHGRKVAPCGFFRIVKPGSTSVEMNVPYTRTAADGWIVLAYIGDRPGPALLRT